MNRTMQLIESGVKIRALVVAGQVAKPKRVRLRICRFGPECPSCGGAAWIRDCSTKKPTPACPPRAYFTESAQAFKAHLKRCVPNWMRGRIS